MPSIPSPPIKLKIDDLTPASALIDTFQLEVDLTGTASFKITLAQLRNYCATDGTGSLVWGGITGNPNDQADLIALLNLKAPLANPAFTGTVTGVTKAMVGLTLVENIALSSWGGSTNVTTLGTITTGVWNGAAITDTYIASANAWNAKQNTLISGTNVKTINAQSILGSGDITISSGGTPVWGGITGNPSDQTDLITLLNLRSPVAGSTGITTLGTIATGVWNGTAISDTYISSASNWNAKQNALGFTPENTANKAINLTSPDDIKFPTTLAVSTALSGKQPIITSGTAPPSGGSDGDIYIQYTA